MKKELNLGKEKINKLLVAFAVPCVISSLINSIYNIVDQIFIGQGVGTLGNAATNVIFPLVIILSAVAGLIGNGGAANFALKLGGKKKEEAAKGIGQTITATVIASVVLCALSAIFLPKLIYLFGCTENVFQYALDYGQIILIGAPFMIFYSAVANIIRTDGSPKYSMMMLLSGAIMNIILDPIFIFGLNMGVKGGALATIIGQIISFVFAVGYLFHIKSVKLSKKHFKLDKNIFKILSLGLSSFITQSTVLVLFIFMNNVMTKLGAESKFGSDIPLSVYGIISKVNSLYISTVIGISIGAQPIIGFNYGAGNKDRVKEVLKKVLVVNFAFGILFNVLFALFPTQIIGIFISRDDASYATFMEFAELMCHSFILVCGLNALEMTTSVLLQSLGKVFKATMLSFTRQIILLIPISLLFSLGFGWGIYGVLYAGLIADILTFIFATIVYLSEYKSLSKDRENVSYKDEESKLTYKGKQIVVTIAREYGSGGRFVGQLLAKDLGVKFYDKELISLAAKESGLSESYVGEEDERKTIDYINNNDDLIFLAEQKVIKDIAKKDALKTVRKINKDRREYYKYYTETELNDMKNYDLCFNSDLMSVEEIAQSIKEIALKKA